MKTFKQLRESKLTQYDKIHNHAIKGMSDEIGKKKEKLRTKKDVDRYVEFSGADHIINSMEKHGVDPNDGDHFSNHVVSARNHLYKKHLPR